MRINKEKSKIIREVIKINGGVCNVARSLTEIFEEDFTKQRVCNWYRQGMPIKYAKVLVSGTEYRVEDLF